MRHVTDSSAEEDLDRTTSFDPLREVAAIGPDGQGWQAVRAQGFRLHRQAGNQTFKAFQTVAEHSERAQPRGNRFLQKSSPRGRVPHRLHLLPILGHLPAALKVQSGEGHVPTELLPASVVERSSIRMTIGSGKEGSGQHIVVWESAWTTTLADGTVVTLEAGSCDLSVYPLVKSDAFSPPRPLRGSQLRALEKMIVELATAPGGAKRLSNRPQPRARMFYRDVWFW